MQGFYPSNLPQIYQGIIPYAYGTQDPTVVATSGTQGQLFLRLPTGTLYRKNDNGETTNWAPFSVPTSITVNGISPVNTLNFTNLNVVSGGPQAVNITANVSAVNVGSGTSIIASTSGLQTTYKTLSTTSQRYLNITSNPSNVIFDFDISNAASYNQNIFSIFETEYIFKGTQDNVQRFGPALRLNPMLNPLKYSVVFEDFYNAINSLTSGFTAVVSGTSAFANVIQIPIDITEVGVVRLGTGSTATGRAAIFNSGDSIRLGNNRFLYQQRSRVVAGLSNPTDRYILRYGLMNSVTTGATEPTRGIYFRYRDDQNNGNWVLVCRSFNIETVINTSIPPTISSFSTYSFIYRAGLGVEFFIDGVSVGTITNNIPIGFGNELGIAASYISKTIGTTTRTVECDYVFCIYELINQSRG
jgi:hypothetical protein